MSLPKRPMPGARERDRLHNQALRALVRAAAALDTYETDGIALALYSTGVAMLRIVELDADAAAGEKVLKVLAAQSKTAATPAEDEEGRT